MQASKETKYKECMPEETVDNIKKILNDIGIELEEKWTDTGLEDFYTLRVSINDSEVFASNGKGATKEYARASAYAEFMERLENDYMTAGPYDEEVWKHRDFILTPDEKLMSAEELADSGNAFVEFLLQVNADKQQKKQNGQLSKADILNLWQYPYKDFGDKFMAVKYYSVKNKQYEYVPQSLGIRFYYTNGMCAGNTPQEALVQGLSEVFERYVNTKTVKEKLALPNIPDEYLKKYDKLYKFINNTEKDGRYKVMIKDGSLGGKYPVVALIIVDKVRQSYGVKFGAHPEFEIALERAVSEALQGKTLEIFTSFSNLLFDPDVDPAVTEPDENMVNIAKVGIGQYPVEIFSEEADYEFTPFDDVTGKSNSDLLKLMLECIISEGHDVLIRDVSYLGFPAYHVIVPGFSEMYRLDLSIIKDAQNCMAVRKTVRNLQNASYEELRNLINHLVQKQNSISENTFAMMTGVEFKDKFIGIPHEHYLLAGICLYKLGNFREASFAWRRMANYSFGSDKDVYFRCMTHYASAAAENIPADEISVILHLFYPADVADEICEKLKDRSKVIEKFYPEIKCYDCNECSIKSNCNYELSRKIKMTLKDRMAAASLTDLSELNI